MVLRLTDEQAQALGVSQDTIREAKLAPMGPPPQPVDGRALLRAAIVAKWPGRVIADETIRYGDRFIFCDFVFPREQVAILAPQWGWIEYRTAYTEDMAGWQLIVIDSGELIKAKTLALAMRTIAKALRNDPIARTVRGIG